MTHILLAFAILFSTCSSSNKKVSIGTNNFKMQAEKVLVVYLSRSNNTKTIVEIIYKNVGGNLVSHDCLLLF